MIIKSFPAGNVAGALKLIKEELGDAAVILKTRVCTPSEMALTGSHVEVTACIDEKGIPVRKAKQVMPQISEKNNMKVKSVSSTTRKGNVKNAAQNDFAAKLEKKLDTILNAHHATEPVGNMDARLRSIYLNLLDADIPVEIARQQIKVMEGYLSFEDDIEQIALRILKNDFEESISSEISIEPGMKIVFAGPTGAGKTSALAKMAAYLSTQKGIKVTLASLDNVKVAAYEEISGYAEMLDVPLDTSGIPEKKYRKDSVLLIDTPPITIHEAMTSQLIDRIREIQPDMLFLVFSSCTRSRDLVDSIISYERIQPTHLIAGHLDESKRWGGILTMTKYLDIPLAYMSGNPGGVGMLEKPDAEKIARRIMKMGKTNDEQ
jgi:flagellar biosynthesis GTPase FlhF